MCSIAFILCFVSPLFPQFWGSLKIHQKAKTDKQTMTRSKNSRQKNWQKAENQRKKMETWQILENC